jgi:hypothetical protein
VIAAVGHERGGGHSYHTYTHPTHTHTCSLRGAHTPTYPLSLHTRILTLSPSRPNLSRTHNPLTRSTPQVESGLAHSHKRRGWEKFTDAVVAAVDRERSGVAFLLWGAPAQKKARRVWDLWE